MGVSRSGVRPRKLDIALRRKAKGMDVIWQ